MGSNQWRVSSAIVFFDVCKQFNLFLQLQDLSLLFCNLLLQFSDASLILSFKFTNHMIGMFDVLCHVVKDSTTVDSTSSARTKVLAFMIFSLRSL